MKYLTGLLVVFLATTGVWADQLPVVPDNNVVAELQKGGYVLFVRHPNTNADQADTDPLHLENTRAQRQLSEEGRRQAKALGQALRALKVPVDKVIASKFQRAVEAAKLMDVGPVETATDVTEG